MVQWKNCCITAQKFALDSQLGPLCALHACTGFLRVLPLCLSLVVYALLMMESVPYITCISSSYRFAMEIIYPTTAVLRLLSLGPWIIVSLKTLLYSISSIENGWITIVLYSEGKIPLIKPPAQHIHVKIFNMCVRSTL